MGRPTDQVSSVAGRHSLFFFCHRPLKGRGRENRAVGRTYARPWEMAQRREEAVVEEDAVDLDEGVLRRREEEEELLSADGGWRRCAQDSRPDDRQSDAHEQIHLGRDWNDRSSFSSCRNGEGYCP